MIWEKNKPDGVLQKLLDISGLADFGWGAQIALTDCLFVTVPESLEQLAQ